MWVISAMPEQHGAGPNLLYALDGTMTESRHRAVKCYSHDARCAKRRAA